MKRAIPLVLISAALAAGCRTVTALQSIQDARSFSAQKESVGADGKTYVRHKILARDEAKAFKEFAAANLSLTARGDCPSRSNCDSKTVLRVKSSGATLTVVPDCDTAVLKRWSRYGDCGLGKTAAYKQLDALLFP